MEMSATATGATTSKSRKYDVFINHRGPDVKKTFVAHLYDALSSRGFRPFLDAEDIAYTVPVFEEIDQALKGACVHVAVFSKGYAESIYCLDELCEMLKSKQPIIPVFYDVEARDLRRIEDGPYNDAFIKHQKRGRSEKIPIWKEALRKVTDYRAIRMDEVNGNEHQLIRRILVEVRIALRPGLLPGKRFGLEKSMKDVVKTLERVSVIGLVGMGGIGKTTLAMEIYNHFLSHQHFEDYCFLRDVQSSQTSVLQEKVLRDLRLESESHCNDQEYRRLLNGALKVRRVLVIVDDISDANQFEALIPEILVILGLDCRIVITSRRHDVLNHVMKALPAACKSVYEVQMLDKFDSRRLFNFHAFMIETPEEDYVELAETIADACGRLPLALEVMGSYLFHNKKPKDKEIWLEAVKVLQENSEIMDKLRVSYDGLPTNGDREMFQDIACMFIGMKQEVAMTIWKSCKHCRCSSSKTPAWSLRNLMNRSLVKLDEHDRLHMHDVLRDMGREIVKTNGVRGQARPPKKWRLLWDRAIAEEVLSHGKVNTKVRGICLTVREPTDKNCLHFPSTMSCDSSNLGNMKKLHLLNLDGCNVAHDSFFSWSQQLRWLQWRFYSFRSFPPQLKLPHLAVLDLSWSTKLTCLWEKNIQIMVNLAQLVILDLTYCIKLTCLWENEAPIQLPLLQELRLVGCSSLVGLPENFGRSVPRLKGLNMTGCWRLQRLPNSIGLLAKLEHLNLGNWSNLTNAIVESVNLAQLLVLDLTNCGKLTCLWENDATIQLPLLEELVLEACSSLVGLPENLGRNAPRLKRLKMTSCRSLQRLPNSIGLLTKLEHLDLQYCSNLFTITIAIVESVNLTQLGLLDLTNCGKLTCLWENDAFVELPLLEELILEACSSLVRLPENLGRSAPKLKRLKMASCLNLQRLPNSIGFLTKLEQLDLRYCSNLITLTTAIVETTVSLAQLRLLDLTNCENLTCLWENDATIELPLLEVLILVGCFSLVALPKNLGTNVPRLKRLEMRGCTTLQTLPKSLGLLTTLDYLIVGDCSNLITLTNAFVEEVNLAQLLVLDFTNCERLTCLWENNVIIELPILKELILEACSSLVGLPENLGRSAPKLKRLKMASCQSLQRLPNSIGLLTKLKQLDLRYCSNLITLTTAIVETVNWAQLGLLDFTNCENLTCLWENNATVELPLLEVLILVDCFSLAALPENLGTNVPRLKRLEMRGCTSLQTLPNSIGLLTTLEYLDLRNCSNFITLTNPIVEAVNLAQLLVLDFTNCEKLTCLWENDVTIELPLLEELILEACSSLVGLPENLGRSAPRLKRLKMASCLNLQRLPNSIGLLTKLEQLDLRYCSDLITLTTAIVESVSLAQLRMLDLTNCENLTCLWENNATIELPMLEVLILVGCFSLAALPENLGTSIPRLKRLEMRGCTSLRTLPNFIGLLTTLEYLDLRNCSNLIMFINPIVELVNLTKLYGMDVNNCGKLTFLWKNDAPI